MLKAALYVFMVVVLLYVGDKIIDAFKSAISQNPYAVLAIFLLSILGFVHFYDSIIDIIDTISHLI
jgi:hypothetical protein